MHFYKSISFNRISNITCLIFVLSLISVIPVNSDTYIIEPINSNTNEKVIDIGPKKDSNILNIGNKLEQSRDMELNATINKTDIIYGPKLEIKNGNINRGDAIAIKPEARKENNKIVNVDKEPEIISFKVIANSPEEGKNSDDKLNNNIVLKQENKGNIVTKFFKKIFGIFR